MSKIIDSADLNVGTELVLDTVAKTYQFVAVGNLIAKDGVSIRALYNKFVELWATAAYQKYPFPMNIAKIAGKYFISFGTDPSGNMNGWKPLDDTTRNMQRDGGWNEYDSGGVLLRVYLGVKTTTDVLAGAQLYYQIDPDDAPINFAFTDGVNQGVQVYGNAANGNFDKRVFFKGYIREEGKLFEEFQHNAEAGTLLTTGLNYIPLALTGSSVDNHMSDADDQMAIAPYDAIAIEYFEANQDRSIDGVNRQFKIIIEGNNATLEQIYTKVQYLLRQNADIDTGAGTVIGQIENPLLEFIGDLLYTKQGVYIDNIQPAENKSVIFNDVDGVDRIKVDEIIRRILFSENLVGAGSSYRLMFTTGPGVDDDYDQVNALTVQDESAAPIEGVITSGSITFTFDHTNDIIGGTAGTDKPVTLVGIRPGVAKFAIATGILTTDEDMTLVLDAYDEI